MESRRLLSSSRPGNMRHNSAAASYAVVESWPDLGDPRKTIVQPPESPNTFADSMKCDSSSLRSASYRQSGSAKPFVPRAQPILPTAPASLYPLLEELDLGQGLSCLANSELAAQFIRGELSGSSEPPAMFRTMIGTVYSQVMIQDTVKLAIQSAERFLPECSYLDSASHLAESFQSLTIELLDILKFGDPRLYTTPIMTTNESTQPDTGSLGTMRYISKFRPVHRGIRKDASYATFPISNNLIVFARIPKRKQPANRIRRLEIAELLLEHTGGTEAEAEARRPEFQVIGKEMLKAYIKMLSRTTHPLGWSGWYPATHCNRRLNDEMGFAEDKTSHREAEEMSDLAPTTAQEEVGEVDQGRSFDVVKQEDDRTGRALVTVRAKHPHPVKPSYEKEDEGIALRDNETEQREKDSEQYS